MLTKAHASAKVAKADAATLPVDAVGDGFELVLGVDCFHGLDTDEQRALAHDDIYANDGAPRITGFARK